MASTPSRTPSQKRRRSSSPSNRNASKRRALEQAPTRILLLTLPGLLAVPPNHRASVTGYAISLAALRKCIALGNLSPDEECRAWTGLAEIGFRLVKAGWSRNDSLTWAKGLDLEVRAH